MEVAGTMTEEQRELAIIYLGKPAKFLTEDSTIRDCAIEIAKQQHIELQDLKRKYEHLKESIGNVLKYH